jgi:N-sulfoglucosamine sulfohydrolase
MEILKKEGVYENTLIIYISDHGIAFPGGKTTVYEPGLRAPCIVRHPDASKRGIVNNALINWTDITPTLLDYAGVESPTYPDGVSPGSREEAIKGLHGRSFLSIIDQENPDGWNEVNASHTFHEIQMYYPMRVVRDRQYKLIWNIAHDLPYPFASDLWAAPTWQDVYKQGMDAMYGPRTVEDYIHRPEFELYDMQNDPWESNNLSGDKEYSELLKKYKGKLHDFQIRTSDPWIMKWEYE